MSGLDFGPWLTGLVLSDEERDRRLNRLQELWDAEHRERSLSEVVSEFLQKLIFFVSGFWIAFSLMREWRLWRDKK